MRRLTISVDDDLADAFNRLVEQKHYLRSFRKPAYVTGNVHIVPVDIKSSPYVQVGHKHVQHS